MNEKEASGFNNPDASFLIDCKQSHPFTAWIHRCRVALFSAFIGALVF